ncbi:N-acetylmannosamine kinase [Austwickia sp. TVS 96-490-7B]|uniref:ROK family protein n=1 Tax=Austwickia sp. TVS 96-490-7B TaxID=2830843 RepID=UPI001C56B758|nr:ROK family protein [Austwickia sp. TVS 96-490-7B]MBW3086890.1 N-acetylmannosamine kinase [Austwickia sp. TVS 96-490-7B]
MGHRDRRVLAVDIGGTKIAAGVVDGSGAVHGRRTVLTPAGDGAAAVMAAAIAVAGLVADEQGVREELCAVGVGAAGVIDPARGVVTHATDALPGWAGTELVGPFAQTFGVPAAVLNDVHAHALGEARYGAGRGAASMLLVAVGTGIGGAYVAGGSVVTGSHHVAGHVGHLSVPGAEGVPCTCGRLGHVEGLASGPGIAAAYRRAGGADLTAAQVVDLAQGPQNADTQRAQEVLHRCGMATGQMIGGLLNVLDPDVVVVTGGVAAAGDLWWAALREGVAADAMDVVASTPVCSATGGVGAALSGAAAWVTDWCDYISQAHRDDGQGGGPSTALMLGSRWSMSGVQR